MKSLDAATLVVLSAASMLTGSIQGANAEGILVFPPLATARTVVHQRQVGHVTPMPVSGTAAASERPMDLVASASTPKTTVVEADASK